ncbi:MAG: hypothetical protein L6Q66_03615 [Bacteroidia bacterium]|nr:hypothetical protein [Bacteroidia bacterium]
MNKVDFLHNGGFPLLLDDLNFDQAATREAFYGLLSAFGATAPTSFIISGCNLSGSAWLPGYLSIAGEILRFDGQALAVPSFGMTNVWDVYETNDSAGQKLLENGTTVQTYKLRKARIIAVSNAVAANYLNVSTAPTLASKLVSIVSADNGATELANKILAVIAGSNLYALKAIEAWRVIGAVGQPAFQNSWANNFTAPARQAAFRKDSMGMVHLRGCISGSNGAVIFNLPAGYRPTANNAALFSVPSSVGYNVNYTLFVDTNGDVSLGGAPAGLVGLYLNGVHFHTD